MAASAAVKAPEMTSYPRLSITTEHHGRRSVLLLQGELDLSTRDRLRRAISNALKRQPGILVVDLSGLDFIDCSGLSVLVWAHKRLAGQDRQLLIAGSTPIVRRVICLAGVDTYLHLSTPEALALGRAGQRQHEPQASAQADDKHRGGGIPAGGRRPAHQQGRGNRGQRVEPG
jgi:anti-anti-sigma factor